MTAMQFAILLATLWNVLMFTKLSAANIFSICNVFPAEHKLHIPSYSFYYVSVCRFAPCAIHRTLCARVIKSVLPTYYFIFPISIFHFAFHLFTVLFLRAISAITENRWTRSVFERLCQIEMENYVMHKCQDDYNVFIAFRSASKCVYYSISYFNFSHQV